MCKKDLIPFTKENAKEKGRLGGIKSGQKRRELKEIRQWASDNLFSERGNNKIPMYQMLFKQLEHLSIQGNLKAIEMLLNYSGLKPVDKVAQTDTEGEDLMNITVNIQPVGIAKQDGIKSKDTTDNK